MDADRIVIETPEHVTFEYELAGLGSRIVAALIDVVIVGLVILFLFLIILLLGTANVLDTGPWFLALGLVGAFAFFWGYPIGFELFWRGQTPGKRALKIRVVREGGYGLTPAVVVVRNLLRLADFLPAAYGLGLGLMMFNRRYKRIGDFVAGTIVIKEPSQAPPPPRVPIRTLAEAEADQVAQYRRAGVHRLQPPQVQMIEDFLRRYPELEIEARRRILEQICDVLRSLLGEEIPRNEKYLRLLLKAYRESHRTPGEAT